MTNKKMIDSYIKAGSLTKYDSPLYIMNRAIMKMINLIETLKDSKDLNLIKKSIHELNLIASYFKEFDQTSINPGVALNFVIFDNTQRDVLNRDYDAAINRLRGLSKVLV